METIERKGNRTKLDWKKDEKSLYMPKSAPETIIVPRFNFFTLSGSGNPNGTFFSDCVSVLYGLSYAVKMSPKHAAAPEDYYEYSVYPLEGIWALTEEGIKEYSGKLDKDKLSFMLMIRQPDFVTEAYARETIERQKGKKPHDLLDRVRFEKIEDGKCVQMLHVGSYDSETVSFQEMETYCAQTGLKRIEKRHKEIYLSDPGRVEPSKMKTVLRFKVS